MKPDEGGMKDISQVPGLSEWVDDSALNWNNGHWRWGKNDEFFF